MQETKRVTLNWTDGLRFTGGVPGGPTATIDGDSAAAPGPMASLLLAAASCSGSDVVVILRKMRVGLRSLRIEVSGQRREEEPRRYTAIHFDYHLGGDGLDNHKATRAVSLSVEKYCSVIHSLAPDIAITYAVTLE
ncbi:MAG TPA: OsmC family protein [Gemmatimonadales bacterium]|nr:OsmC family protein [Gemmatimonadales bacterium]